jgi:DGQHR domain-containing protein
MYKKITVRALRVVQSNKIPLYSFFIKGSDILNLAEFSRLKRDIDGKLSGFQRPEAKRHVNEIKRYLDSENILFPNGIIIAISEKVNFIKSRGPSKNKDEIAEAGHLELQLAMSDDVQRIAWIVDGQQRSLALSRCNKPNLAIPVSAFVSEDLDIQRDQFVRINQGKSLPKNLIDELLPEYNAILPSNLSLRKIPSRIVNWLNQEPSSPFYGLIKRASTNKQQNKAVITDTALLDAIKNSLYHERGCLARHKNPLTNQVDIQGIALTLKSYWTAVKNTFPHAWGKLPKDSRLMHSVGLHSMSVLMDDIMVSIDTSNTNSIHEIENQLSCIKKDCAWTKEDGEWARGWEWNAFQATPSDMKRLTGHILNIYHKNRILIK